MAYLMLQRLSHLSANCSHWDIKYFIHTKYCIEFILASGKLTVKSNLFGLLKQNVGKTQQHMFIIFKLHPMLPSIFHKNAFQARKGGFPDEISTEIDTDRWAPAIKSLGIKSASYQIIAGLFDVYPKASSTKIIAGLSDTYSMLEIGTNKPFSAAFLAKYGQVLHQGCRCIGPTQKRPSTHLISFFAQSDNLYLVRANKMCQVNPT